MLLTTYENVGYSGSGSFIQSGGTNAISNYLTNYLTLGCFAGSVGSYQLSGSGLLTGFAVTVGNSGSGTFTQSGGTNAITNGTLTLGGNAGATGAYNLSGSGLLSVSAYPGGSEEMGVSGSGMFTQSGGTNNMTGSLYLGSSGAYNLTGGVLSASYETICAGGTFSQSAGTNLVADTLSLGTGTSGVASYNLSGGLLNVAALAYASTRSVFTVSGGTIQAGSAFSSSVTMTLGSGGATFDTAGGAVTLSGPLSGSGTLTKVDGGTLMLSGSNSYMGGTAVNAGTLEAAGTAALPGYATQGAITVGKGAVLAVSAGGSGWTAAGISLLLGSNSGGFASGSALGIDTTGGSLAYGGNLNGNLGLVKLGPECLDTQRFRMPLRARRRSAAVPSTWPIRWRRKIPAST